MEGTTEPRRRSTLIVLSAALILVFALLPTAVSERVTAATDERPNVVMFYVDDLGLHDGRLWSNATLTPNIHHYFVEHGVHFKNAFGESPKCCPGRASLLTGLHTHNNGVYRNNIFLMHPTDNLATELRGAGYSTYWLGKYLNVFEKAPASDWAEYVKPWTSLESTYLFTERVRTAAGWIRTGLHPTTYITNRAVSLINNRPADAGPFFTVLSAHNTHYPNKPVPMPPEVLAQCDSIPPWNPPNYNEADVSDKPSHIAALPLLAALDGWSLVNPCKEMFGIDRMVGQVTQALAAKGELDNTLLIFTSDNGMNWGAHRMGSKSSPYATPVPLYMSWPARWGTDPREIDEYVTNIDFAPTFCAITGCTMGPFASGQTGPDGLNLVPLIDGDVPNMGRDALLETIDGELDDSQPWNAIRTTPENALGLWHYVEWSSGEKELYDSVADPWELENLAGDPTHSVVEAALALRLNQLLQEGRVNKPDLAVWFSPSIYHGHNLFGTDPAAQTERLIGLKAGLQRDVSLQLENNSTTADTITLRATSTGKPKISIRFMIDGVDQTASLLGSGYQVSYAGSERRTFILRVKVASGATSGQRRTFVVTATSTNNATKDVARLIAGR